MIKEQQEDEVVNGRNGKRPNARGRHGKGRNGRERSGQTPFFRNDFFMTINNKIKLLV